MSVAAAESLPRPWYDPPWFVRLAVASVFLAGACLCRPLQFLAFHAPEIPILVFIWTVAGVRPFSWEARHRKRFADAWPSPSLPSEDFRVLSVTAPGPSLAPASRSGAPAICQVCGDAIRGRHVVCRACSTPHHEDCWAYMKKCSVFACDCPQALTVIRRDGERVTPEVRLSSRRPASRLGA